MATAPELLRLPKDVLRHWTARRSARSAELLVGSTPSWSTQSHESAWNSAFRNTHSHMGWTFAGRECAGPIPLVRRTGGRLGSRLRWRIVGTTEICASLRGPGSIP